MSHSILGKFPEVRLRRARRTKSLRRLTAETELSSSDLIYPVFILEGKDKVEPVESMPGISRKTIDQLIKELTEVSDMGIPAIALFYFVLFKTTRISAIASLSTVALTAGLLMFANNGFLNILVLKKSM